MTTAIAEKKTRGRPRTGGPTTGRGKRTFILDDEAMDDIDLIARFHAQDSGLACSWSAAIRIATRKEATRIRSILARVSARKEGTK